MVSAMELRGKAEVVSSGFLEDQISPAGPLTGPLMMSQAANDNANLLDYAKGSAGASRLDTSAESARREAPRLSGPARRSFGSFLRSDSGGFRPPRVTSEPVQTDRKWPSHGSGRGSHASAERSEAWPPGPWRRFVPEQRFFSADRHLTQRNAELGGAALLSNKERFQNIWTSTVLDASRLCAPCPCATRCNLQ